ncbi:hypothetical protein GON03_16875 [Nocardioides sp. MAH-18]|uniref:DUF1097 domain-containing protein n=1 Tax=Nocardioides agri TaxID=2682843 RepID=A0A6L6XVN5_9ACTN|nr:MULTISPECIES: hypothetical protein [unclassified Nocardioides]MBA2956014.1 hypothetical protein [Nocardioides sp. CGMCC 1.13656]MVQ50862.1 hypothetical protein [Nocardioides sp. MAH-18]
MKRLLTAGAVLAAMAFLLILNGDRLGLDLSLYGLFGLATGAVLASMTGGTASTRALGFVLGFVVAWAAYAVRAGALPDAASGHAVAATVALLILTVVAAALRSRALFASSLLGVVALVGAYEKTFSLSPDQFLNQSPTAATTVLLAAGLGFLGAIIAAQIASTFGTDDLITDAHEIEA